MKEKMLAAFEACFDKKPTQFFFCPGRVNLIGEHIDYNGGKVLPAAISLGTYLAVAPGEAGLLRFRCLDFPETMDWTLDTIIEKKDNNWYNYPLGVIKCLQEQGAGLQGLDLLYAGNLPIGAGLSSSASIEVLTAFALDTILHLGMSKLAMVQIAKKAENEFMGVNCGIMDQFAVAFGEMDRALLLDCDTLDYETVDCRLGDHCLAIINTHTPRTLADSKYNERFAECREALAALQQELPIRHLCEMDMHRFQQYRHLISDPVKEKRVLHVVSENFRVGEAVDALRAGEPGSFGKMLYASHQSLKDWYAVTGVELDTVVEFCRTFTGVLGARMTGAGFGGCAIALMRTDAYADFSQQLLPYFKEKIGYDCAVFQSAISRGVGVWND
jgi:galactokinase